MSGIASSFDEALAAVKVLVSDFKAQEAYYLSPDYNEAEVRKDFVDKFLKALGWDVDHEVQKNPYAQEVKVEKGVEVKGRNKKADYAFFVSPDFRDELFFVEAKKPSRDLSNADDYFQVARYSWSRNSPIAVLTDFEEFHIIDCRQKPDIETILQRKLQQYHYSEFKDPEKFGKIYYLFSREAVAASAIEKYVQSLSAPRGKAVQKGLFKGGYKPVDESFLDQLDEYRLTLARAFKKADQSLTGPALTEAIQRTLDRLVFLRFLEDKMIEPEEYVSSFGDSGTVWADFMASSKKLKAKYNGLIFNEHPIDAKGFHAPDDGDFGSVCEDISHLNSPFDFNAIPIEILGSIYERFLGKVVHATSKQVKVEDKPEVRKAGGVYYTPSYIVRYIVENTVGKAIAGKTPDEIANLKFADISCGSGSFLLGVYDCILRYHERWYQEHPPTTGQKKASAAVHKVGDRYVLSIEAKRAILLNNIYGVDHDPQAVEVTSVSLYLKLLEDESLESLRQLQLLTQEAVLPSLDKNIKCGNSLVSTDYFGEQLLKDPEELTKVRPLDWKLAFPDVYKAGGFDVVLGNPPYIRIQTLSELTPRQVDYFGAKYKAAQKGNYDIYVLFVERGLELLKPMGSLGFILPHKFLNAQYGESLRTILASGKHMSHLVHFGDQQVFKDASTYTCLLFLDKMGVSRADVVRVQDLEAWRKTGAGLTGELKSSSLSAKEWNIVVGPTSVLFERLDAIPTKLEQVTSRIFQGIKTSADKIYIVEERERTPKRVKVFSPHLQSEVWLEPGLLHPLVKGGDSKRYHLAPQTLHILFPYAMNASQEMDLLPVKSLKEEFPLTWDYLAANKKYLENREEGKMKGPGWYGYIYPKALDVMSLPKLFTPDLSNRAAFSLDATGELFFTGGVAGGYGILPAEGISREVLLGLLNSRLLEWFNRQIATQMRGGWFSYEARFIRRLPILGASTSAKETKTAHDQIRNAVIQILGLNKQLEKAKTETDRKTYQSQISALETQIDVLVFNLYSVSEKERRLILEIVR